MIAAVEANSVRYFGNCKVSLRLVSQKNDGVVQSPPQNVLGKRFFLTFEQDM
jgi:hypothetical protein